MAATVTSSAAAAAPSAAPSAVTTAPASVSSPAGIKQQQQGRVKKADRGLGGSMTASTTRNPAVPKQPNSLYTQLVTALHQHPSDLFILFSCMLMRGPSLNAAAHYIVDEVERCTGVDVLEVALQTDPDPQPAGAQKDPDVQQEHEVLEAFLYRHQRSDWEVAWGGVYRPQEEARHAQRLKAYVQAAGRRAAQQAPAVASLLQELLELGDSN
jgi:hypothetical protein